MLLPVLHLFNDGYYAAMPLILPFAAEEIELSLSLVGLLGSILSFSGVILALPAAAFSSVFGTLRTLSAAVLMYALGFLLLSVSPDVFFIIAAFILGSIAFGIFHPIAFSAVARDSSDEQIGKNMGVFAASGDIGRIAFTSALTFIIGMTTWRTTSFIYGAAALLLFIPCIIIALRKKDYQAAKQKKAPLDCTILRNKDFVLSNAASLMDSFANSSLFIFIPFLLIYRNIDPSFISLFTSVFFAGNLIGKIAMGRLTGRIGENRLFICSEVSIFIALALLASAKSVIVILFLAIMLGFLTKGTVPITSTMIARSVRKAELETAYSMNSLSTSIANTAAPLFFGFLADFIGIQAVFIACGFSALLSAVPVLIIQRKRSQDEKTGASREER